MGGPPQRPNTSENAEANWPIPVMRRSPVDGDKIQIEICVQTYSGINHRRHLEWDVGLGGFVGVCK